VPKRIHTVGVYGLNVLCCGLFSHWFCFHVSL